MNILMVLTSHGQMGSSDKKTGFWLEEFVEPYYVFKDAGAHITLASPEGGQPPIDPRSEEESATQSPLIQRFRQDKELQAALADTVLLSSVSHEEFDAVFYPGGHGPLWDLAQDRDSIMFVEAMHAAGKPVGAVCHGPAVLVQAQRYDGRPLVEGKRVTGFTNTEEEAVQLTGIVPFLVEDALKQKGGIYERGPDWASHVVADGGLVTGQNPASSGDAARMLLKVLAD